MKFTFILLLLFYFTPSSWAQPTELSGLEAMQVRQKTTCGTLDKGKTRYGIWEGRGYSRVPGEKDRHLFNVIGINTRQCNVKNDPVKGRGFRSVSREVMVYLDAETNEIIDTWTNPWSGEEVEVLHVANDPVNMHGWAWQNDENGNNIAHTSYRDYGKVAATSYEIPLFYDNPLGSDYQVYIGGAYHAMEIFNTYYDKEELTNPKITDLSRSNISWSRVAQWLPWMMMGDRSGIMIFNATGYSTFEEDEIWDSVKKILNERYPLYKTPPPIDDPRVNETSWTVFQKYMDGKKKVTVRERAKRD